MNQMYIILIIILALVITCVLICYAHTKPETKSLVQPLSNNNRITNAEQCKYKKFGYYNVNLSWFRQTNCI